MSRVLSDGLHKLKLTEHVEHKLRSSTSSSSTYFSHKHSTHLPAPLQTYLTTHSSGVTSDVNKDLTLKAKDRTKDLTLKAKDRTKDWNLVLKDNQGPRTKAKDNITGCHPCSIINWFLSLEITNHSLQRPSLYLWKELTSWITSSASQ